MINAINKVDKPFNTDKNNITAKQQQAVNLPVLKDSFTSKSKPIPFKGLQGAITSAMGVTENFIGEFLAVDLFGMITPRTAQGYTRNQEELGHLNYKAGTEELIRELLSGPAFFYVPAITIAAACKLADKSANIKRDTLNKFKNIFSNITKNVPNLSNIKNPEEQAKIQTDFVKSIFSEYSENHQKGTVDKIVDGFKTLINNKNLDRATRKKTRKDITENLASLNRNLAHSVDDVSIIKDKGFKIKELLRDIPNYFNLMASKIEKESVEKLSTTKSVKEFIETAHKGFKKVRTRAIVAASSILSLYLIIVPKLYQQDKKFPGLQGLNTDTPDHSKGGSIASK